ncbi:hypothetical protein FQN49_002243 [Arthroderma sp. PD_2]|nr:hypothetical protein FQN49_002243 [Arthroderma sp. PD_2]
MPVIWNDASRAKLLMAIVKTNGGKVDYRGICEFMGPEYNAKCIQNQIQFIKNKASGEKAPGSAPSTPAKGGKKTTTDPAKTPVKSPASAKRGRKPAANPGPEGDSDDEEPSANHRMKKVKTEVKREVKAEEN